MGVLGVHGSLGGTWESWGVLQGPLWLQMLLANLSLIETGCMNFWSGHQHCSGLAKWKEHLRWVQENPYLIVSGGCQTINGLTYSIGWLMNRGDPGW